MSVLTPTNFETLTYNMPNWSTILNTNWQSLNTYMAKFNILWDGSATDAMSIKWDAASGKWVATVAGDMLKSTYDINNSGIVDKAESLDDGTNTATAAQVAGHLTDTNNPHSVTAAQIGLGNVTNDAQLKRSAGDINTFTEKTTLSSTDVLLIEDSGASYAKKKVQIGNLPAGSGGSTTFTGLIDTPTSYTGQAGNVVAVKATEDGVEFVAATGTGDMTKAVYDTNNSGVVDNSEKLNGMTAFSIQTISGTNIDWNVSVNAKITLSANTTLTFTAPAKPSHLFLEVVQDATGGWTLTLPTIKWQDGVVPTLPTAANSISIISLIYDGTNYLGEYGVNYG